MFSAAQRSSCCGYLSDTGWKPDNLLSSVEAKHVSVASQRLSEGCCSWPYHVLTSYPCPYPMSLQFQPMPSKASGEVQASGFTPRKLEKELATKLQSFISEPEVTVVVTEVKSQKFNVLGRVSRPGSYPLTNPPAVRPLTPPEDLPVIMPSLYPSTVHELSR